MLLLFHIICGIKIPSRSSISFRDQESDIIHHKLSLGSPGRLQGRFSRPEVGLCSLSRHSEGHGPAASSAASSTLSPLDSPARLGGEGLWSLEEPAPQRTGDRVGDSSESWGQGFGTSFGFSKGTYYVRISSGVGDGGVACP